MNTATKRQKKPEPITPPLPDHWRTTGDDSLDRIQWEFRLMEDNGETH